MDLPLVLIATGSPGELVAPWVIQLKFNWAPCVGGLRGFFDFIADNYNRLPALLIYTEAEDRSEYHYGSLVELLNHPGFEDMFREKLSPGFIPFGRDKLGTLHSLRVEMLKRGWWPKTMQPYFGSLDNYGDYSHGKVVAVEFGVTRDKILRLPREFYGQMAHWFREHSDTHIFLIYSLELIFTCYQVQPRMEINGCLILALYGAGSYQRDVTVSLLRHSLTETGLRIPRTSFNDMFGDHLVGIGKVLTVYLNDAVYQFAESHREWTFDFVTQQGTWVPG